MSRLIDPTNLHSYNIPYHTISGGYRQSASGLSLRDMGLLCRYAVEPCCGAWLLAAMDLSWKLRQASFRCIIPTALGLVLQGADS